MSQRKVALFVTCLVDLFRPTVGFAALKLLEQAGCDVSVPGAQTCCGQPAFNSGDRGNAQKVARGLIEAFEPFDYVVAPSGSCAGMIRKHYPELFAGDDIWEARAKSQPRKLLDKVAGLNLTELPGAEVCCGFGGTFCVKYADISNAIVADKTEDILATGADTLLAGDLGCLMNMAGKLSREGRPVKVRHVAEVLADMTGDVAPISQGPES